MQEYVGETAKDDTEAEERIADGTDYSRTSADISVRKPPGMDHFNYEESDPKKSNAMSTYFLPFCSFFLLLLLLFFVLPVHLNMLVPWWYEFGIFLNST